MAQGKPLLHTGELFRDSAREKPRNPGGQKNLFRFKKRTVSQERGSVIQGNQAKTQARAGVSEEDRVA